MKFGSVAAVAGVVFWVLFSSAALLISIRNSRDTRAYKDPVFVLECEAIVLDKAVDGSAEQAQVCMKLVNSGESFATDVSIVAEFDPYGLHVRPAEWAFVPKDGGSVPWYTSVGVSDHGGAGVLQALDTSKGENLCTVKFRSQAGHKREVRIPLPDVFAFVTFKDSNQIY
ncbi:hypothetical protein ACX80D_05925 [Arthrobacter sp. Sr24]